MFQTKAMKDLNKGKKIRKKSWWWGRYIKKVYEKIRLQGGEFYPESQIPTCSKEYDNEWEEYDEELHGEHNEIKD